MKAGAGVSGVAGMRDCDHASAARACLQTNYERTFRGDQPACGAISGFVVMLRWLPHL